MRTIILVLLALNLVGCASAPWVSTRPRNSSVEDQVKYCEDAAEKAGQGFWENKNRFVEKCMYHNGFARDNS